MQMGQRGASTGVTYCAAVGILQYVDGPKGSKYRCNLLCSNRNSAVSRWARGEQVQ
jgi:hypothetical protein